MEYMCLECGVSFYLENSGHQSQTLEGTDVKVLHGMCCEQCGGPLMVIGKAGDEPHYRLKPE